MPGFIKSDIDLINEIPVVPLTLDVVCRTTGMGFAAVARVTADRWLACSVKDDIQFGLQSGGELKIETTICREVMETGRPVIIDNVAEDERYRSAVPPVMYGFQSCISLPIALPTGQFFGTLCAFNPQPARLNTPETIGMFKLFAELIGYHLDVAQRVTAAGADLAKTRDQLASSLADLAAERSIAALREQFVAILGHDLRNPLAAIQSGITLLRRTPPKERAAEVLGMMQQSSTRMGELIWNMLDFARVRLGGGMGLNRIPAAPVGDALEQVVGELRASWPDRSIETTLDLAEPVTCDPNRIGQLCSNLVSNALTYGSKTLPIRVEAASRDGMFELSVINSGTPIAEAALPHLFQPFSRGEVQSNQKGLGLGLHIAAEIAHAHGGTMTVNSTEAETRFMLTMPAK